MPRVTFKDSSAVYPLSGWRYKPKQCDNAQQSRTLKKQLPY